MSKNKIKIFILIILISFIQTHLLFSALREVKVGALYMGGTHEFTSPLITKINEAALLVAEAGKLKLDIVVLAETYFRGRTMASQAQDLSNSVLLDSVKVWAKKYNVNIVFQVYELEFNPTKIYNTAVLVDRDGNYIGKYRKVNPAPGSEALLLTAGDSYPVFDIDVGKIGMLICWDGWFTNPAKILADNGAEIIIIPTSENDYRNMKTITAENGVPVAYSVDHVNDIPSSVFNHHGDSVYYDHAVGLNKLAIGTVILGNFKNLALNKPVQASSDTDPQNTASNVVDGQYSTERDTPEDEQTSWKVTSLPQWIEIDLENDYDIDMVSIATFNTDGYEYKIEGKAVNGNYELLSDQFNKVETEIEWNIAGSEIFSSQFDKKKVRYVKLTVNSTSHTDVTINEIKVFGYIDDETGITGNEFNHEPEKFILSQNYPNPFNSWTTIQFNISEPSQVKLEILNTVGQQVVILAEDHYNAGKYQINWNGEDHNNSEVLSGMYLCRMIVDGQILSRKVLLLK
jgi:predicted amidohydrolase